ncbi:hypothetical protein [Chitinophaga sp. LS1]|uniref:hypothetical protein n=1 Tax=Chitinophaga sp. LS1 TaxID=3051176 RepID=UPI002AABCD33|nr:hypothetical protein [Chitinophaga sp. LS1]WPV68002.1 hypothetical protein QQL36_04585 [Chitinophaga sp. LS1]
MNTQDIQRLKSLAERILKNGITREEALLSLQRAGHLDKDGNFTKHYQHLARAIAANTANSAATSTTVATATDTSETF